MALEALEGFVLALPIKTLSLLEPRAVETPRLSRLAQLASLSVETEPRLINIGEDVPWRTGDWTAETRFQPELPEPSDALSSFISSMTLRTASLISESVRSDLELPNDFLCCCCCFLLALSSLLSSVSALYPTDEPTGVVGSLPPSLLSFMLSSLSVVSSVYASFTSRGRARRPSPAAKTGGEASGEVGEEVEEEETARGEVGDGVVVVEVEEEAAMEAEKLAATTLP